MASENPEFGLPLARRLNQSRASAVLQSNRIAIKFGTAEARCINWALYFFKFNILSSRFDDKELMSNACNRYFIETLQTVPSLSDILSELSVVLCRKTNYPIFFFNEIYALSFETSVRVNAF